MTHQWSVVTVTYNSLAHLERHWSATEGRQFYWIVVDNGSTDGTVEFARRRADRVIETGHNAGFATANNQGFDRVATEFVAFVNPDVTVDPSGWQTTFESTIASTGGLVAPQLLNSDRSEQPNARGLPFLAAKIRNRLNSESDRGVEYARAGFQTPTYCAWVMGAALAGKAEDFRKIGGWDEAYFLYYEDHEIGLRAWRHGLPVVVDPDVRWVHAWQRATIRPNLRAWKVELASMNTFYKRHREFLLGNSRSPSAIRRVRAAGYDELLDRLWEPAPCPPVHPGQESPC